MLRYFRNDLIATNDGDAQRKRDPIAVFYELDDVSDFVIRMIGLYNDACLRNSVSRQRERGFDLKSLVDFSFSENIKEWGMEEISSGEFESYWARGVDGLFD